MPIYLLSAHRIMYPIYRYVEKKKLFIYFLLIKRKNVYVNMFLRNILKRITHKTYIGMDMSTYIPTYTYT